MTKTLTPQAREWLQQHEHELPPELLPTSLIDAQKVDRHRTREEGGKRATGEVDEDGTGRRRPTAIPQTILCRTCSTPKPPSDFYAADQASSTGECKSCRNRRTAKWREANRGSVTQHNRRARRKGAKQLALAWGVVERFRQQLPAEAERILAEIVDEGIRDESG